MFIYPIAFNTEIPKSAGLSATIIPADFIASILSSAPPFPPATIAPACPILLPGGAVLPAMNPAVGFDLPLRASSFKNCAASSSADQPISPIIIIDCVSSSLRNHSKTSMCSVPLTGSPPIPTHVD